MALFSSVKEKLAQPGLGTRPVAADDLSQLLATKATGKAQAPTGPARSNIAAQVAASQAGQRTRQVREAGRQDVAQVAAETAQAGQVAEEQQKQHAQQYQLFRAEVGDRLEALANKLDRHWDELNTKQKIAGLEQAGFVYRLGQQEYVNNLRTARNELRAGRDIDAKEALLAQTLGQNRELLDDYLDQYATRQKMQRAIMNDLAGINLQTTISLLDAETSQMQTEGRSAGVSEAMRAGFGALSKVDWDSEPDSSGGGTDGDT